MVCLQECGGDDDEKKEMLCFQISMVTVNCLLGLEYIYICVNKLNIISHYLLHFKEHF